MGLKDIVTAIFFSVIFVFVFIVATYISGKIFVAHSIPYIENGLAAFMGAFFAFLFLRVSDWLTKLYDRQVKGYNGLVKLDQALNRNLALIAHELFVMKSHEGALKETKEEDKISSSPQKFDLFPIHDEILLELTDIKLINELFRYNDDLRKVNYDMSAANDSLNNLIQYSRDRGDVATYLYNVEKIKSQSFPIYKKFLNNKIKEETFNLLAKTRVLSKRKRPLFTKIMFWIIRIDYSEKLLEKIKDEKKTVLEEYKLIQKESLKEIKKIINKKD